MRLCKSLSTLLAMIVGGVFFGPAQCVSAQPFVDCSGSTEGAYTSIGSALADAGNGAYIVVMPGTTCNEDVTINGMANVSIGTSWMERAAINGSLNVIGSQNIYLYGFDITSPNNDGSHPAGIYVASSSNVMINACTSRYNQSNGLRVESGSSASVGDWGNFSFNGSSGVSVGGHSYLSFVAWGGEIDIMSNRYSGLYVDRSQVDNLGHVSINNNLSGGSTQPDGFGIDMRGPSTGIMFGVFGVAEVSGNQGGGISLMENSEISMGGNQDWAPHPALIATNGSTGISASFGSQVTMIGGVQIVEHLTTGFDIYGKSQAAVYGDNLITRIGSIMGPGKAAIRVDGNSELYMRNGTISQNNAPGILALVNSSVDAIGVSFSSNAGPNFVCDSSAVLAGDMKPGSLGSANACNVLGPTGLNHRLVTPSSAPDWRTNKAAADRFKAVSARFRR